MNTLVIGGTSGLGLELARRFEQDGDDVWVTGRHDPAVAELNYEPFDLTGEDLPERISDLFMRVPHLNRLVYAAGFSQEKPFTELAAQDIKDMVDVGALAPMYFLWHVLRTQGGLGELLMITSTSAWTPRPLEAPYNFVKAGEALYAEAMAKSGLIGRTLVVGPSGMNTPFWEGSGRGDVDQMLDPAWVADEIMGLRGLQHIFASARILRNPPRTETSRTDENW